ncbi:MAG: hypothetical protein JRG96_03725 [Deltaproteobacteria bacterium]|nr:hypothetical protein [Deltaproteobacteria bacterium]MBW2418450.1 hypothetical protein [Deltaproteobacteria bacterium]
MAKPGALSESILLHQRRWAEQRCIDLSEAGHALGSNANLMQPLSPPTRAELEWAPRRPLGDGAKPADLQLLHSTDALLCNVFDYWRERELAPLATACGADSRTHGLRFAQHSEEQSGPAPAPPDLLLHGDDARATAIVASFTEPYASQSQPGEEIGRVVECTELRESLPGCHNLARDLDANRGRYRALPVVRLLELCRELTRRHGRRGFRLLYLWYDADGLCSGRHSREIDRFRMRVGGEVDFEARSWQELFQRLRGEGADHRHYLDYLRTRYFPSSL